MRTAVHEANVQAKALRALAAAHRLVRTVIHPHPAFGCSTEVDAYRNLHRWLYDPATDPELSTTMWALLGATAAEMTGSKPVSYRTSRPYIEVLLLSHIALLRAEPVDGSQPSSERAPRPATRLHAGNSSLTGASR